MLLQHGNYTQPNTNNPCSTPNTAVPYVNCCVPGDICMEDNLCHYTKSSVNGSGYYLATCTDPFVKDATWAHNCLKGAPDVVFIGTGDLWACCGTTNGDLDSTKTTSDTFTALPIDDLQTVGFPDSDITATSILSSTATSASTATGYALTKPSSPGAAGSPTPSFNPNPSSHLSNSIIAGLAVGATIILIFGIVIGAFIMRATISQRLCQESLRPRNMKR